MCDAALCPSHLFMQQIFIHHCPHVSYGRHQVQDGHGACPQGDYGLMGSISSRTFLSDYSNERCLEILFAVVGEKLYTCSEMRVPG